MKKLLVITSLFFSLGVIAQETHGDRTISYTVDLDRLKFEKQELSIEKSLKNMEGVKSCDVDALNYKLYISIFDPIIPRENFTPTNIDDIKIVLANNNVEIKNYTQKIIID